MISSNKVQKDQLKIGLFTDTYRPTVNGISVVVDTFKRQMETAGHEVTIVCPATHGAHKVLKTEDSVITVPSIKGWPYREYDISFFWPPQFRKKLLAEKFDVIIFFTPGQLGLMAMDVAHHARIPVIAQHSTDLEKYITQYMGGPLAAMAVLFGLPLFAGTKAIDWRAWRHAWRPQPSLNTWGTQLIHEGLGMWYGLSETAIALSRKSKQQIVRMPYVNSEAVVTIPVGVDALTPVQNISFRANYHIPEDVPLLLYVGRISREKNLDVIIPMMEHVLREEPLTHFAFVGDFDYKKTLEKKAHASSAGKNIHFTGKIPREQLAGVYGAADMFIFPSTTDTQGLVVHEAVHAGLPVVMTDGAVTEVVRDGRNGFIVGNDPLAFAHAALELLRDTKKRLQFSAASKQLAAEYTEVIQTTKLLAHIQNLLKES